jgi:hypothetical protein
VAGLSWQQCRVADRETQRFAIRDKKSRHLPVQAPVCGLSKQSCHAITTRMLGFSWPNPIL